MYKKAAAMLLAGVVIAGGTFLYLDEAKLSFGRVLASLTTVSEAVAQSGDMPAPKVPVAEVVTRTVAPAAQFTGHLEATKIVELRPRVGGAVDKVSVPEGQLVQSGKLLFQLDPRPFQVVLDAALAELQQANILLDQAGVDFKRIETLAPKGTVSRKSFDDAQATRRLRQAQVGSAKAAVEAAELDLSFTQITAPIAGRVDRVLVTEGNLVTGGSGGAATLLTTIVSTNPLYVYFDIDEGTYLDFVSRVRLTEGRSAEGKLPVLIGLMTDKGYPHTGELDFLSNRIDRSTGTIRARALVKNSEGKLAPGLFARVNLITSEPAQTVLINDEAIGIDQGRRYVLALGPENKAEYRTVELGPVIDGLRVVSQGLKAGDKIIIKGLARPGMQVDPQMTPMISDHQGDIDQTATDAQEARR